MCYYLVEAGKTILEIDETRRFLDLDNNKPIELSVKTKNGELNTYDAEAFFKEALSILEGFDTEEEEIKRNKIHLHLARADIASENLADALKEAQKARELNPLSYEEREVLGKIFCKLKEFKYGLSELNTAVTYRPDDPDLLLCAGRAYLSAGKDCKKKGDDRNRILRNARDRLREALEIVDRSDIMKRGKIRYWIGKTLLELGGYEEAIPHFRILVKKENYKDPLPALYLGYAFLKCNSHQECESTLYRLIRSLKSMEDKSTIDKFYGQQYDDKRHVNDILARAYIYLAYSFAERDANPCDSWMLAGESQSYIKNLREKIGFKEEWTRDGVLPKNSQLLCAKRGYGFLSISASEDSGKLHKKSAVSHSLDGIMIEVKFDPTDGPRKRKSKAHLAECAGTICYKMGELSKAVDYLNASIALDPDAGAYINLAKAYERMILCGVAEDSDKDLIDRTIRDLCRHAEALDLRNEHKEDLIYFRKIYLDREKGSNGCDGDLSKSGDKAGEAKAGEAKDGEACKEKSGK